MKRFLKLACFLFLFVLTLYGASRLYYKVTAGFTIGNITSDYAYDERWHVADLSFDQKRNVKHILDQEFTYLGKGCQSYVFLSQDKHYVLKFFKYQRFRPQAWLEYLDFIPGMKAYRLNKVEKKKEKLEGVYRSWKIAFEELSEQTGVVFVHINKTNDLNQTIVIRDKMGFTHHLQADQTEFLLQKSAKMLCPSLKELVAIGNHDEAKALLDDLVQMLVAEYQQGYADNDHALMQNTGVIDNKPIHIDVGQFIKNECVKDPNLYTHELFNKTYKFRKWLEARYPDLHQYLTEKLQRIIGEQFASMKPYSHQGDVAKIPHQE